MPLLCALALQDATYRWCVVHRIKTLKQLDTRRVTEEERKQAAGAPPLLRHMCHWVMSEMSISQTEVEPFKLQLSTLSFVQCAAVCSWCP